MACVCWKKQILWILFETFFHAFSFLTTISCTYLISVVQCFTNRFHVSNGLMSKYSVFYSIRIILIDPHHTQPSHFLYMSFFPIFFIHLHWKLLRRNHNKFAIWHLFRLCTFWMYYFHRGSFPRWDTKLNNRRWTNTFSFEKFLMRLNFCFLDRKLNIYFFENNSTRNFLETNFNGNNTNILHRA